MRYQGDETCNIKFCRFGNAFSEASIVPSRHVDVITETFETEWIIWHGATEFVCGDEEFYGTK